MLKKTRSFCLLHSKEINHEIGSSLNKRLIKSTDRSDFIIANSNFTKELAIRVGINPSKIHVIFPGIQKPKIVENISKIKAEKIFGDSFPKIITVSRLDKRKGHDKILMLIKNLKPKFPKIKYISIGSGDEEKNLFSKNINIVGIYDPSDYDLSMYMWSYSNGAKILEIIDKIKNINLSKDAKEILNVALLTNSYFPNKNISKEQFLIIKSEWLIKQQDLDLIETYLSKNNSLEEGSDLVRYYVDYYLSRSDLGKACDIFNKINFEINDDYVSKFKIYCFINSNKNEEAQLHFDLLKEYGFSDIFFEKKFAYLVGYDETINKEISEKSLLDFHLSHRTDLDFKFEPKINTPKLIWKYLSSSNLLENIDLIDLEDKEKLLTIEMATHEKNYKEVELFALYERFKFNINQLLTVEETYKLLPSSESRALVYQGILITKETSEKIKLIKLLNLLKKLPILK